jgi:hypothetical protein
LYGIVWERLNTKAHIYASIGSQRQIMKAIYSRKGGFCCFFHSNNDESISHISFSWQYIKLMKFVVSEDPFLRWENEGQDAIYTAQPICLLQPFYNVDCNE